ncbi:MAG: hypothetical protein HY321_16905, partial [Armatimonadetes bacterium]|nr:hypothetical protein [Armatimonadota bacterium]
MRTPHNAVAWAACVLLTQGAAWPASTPAEAPPEIFPTPKQMTLTGGRFDLVSDGLPTALIVLGNPPTRQSEIAA